MTGPCYIQKLYAKVFKVFRQNRLLTCFQKVSKPIFFFNFELKFVKGSQNNGKTLYLTPLAVFFDLIFINVYFDFFQISVIS